MDLDDTESVTLDDVDHAEKWVTDKYLARGRKIDCVFESKLDFSSKYVMEVASEIREACANLDKRRIGGKVRTQLEESYRKLQIVVGKLRRTQEILCECDLTVIRGKKETSTQWESGSETDSSVRNRRKKIGETGNAEIIAVERRDASTQCSPKRETSTRNETAAIGENSKWETAKKKKKEKEKRENRMKKNEEVELAVRNRKEIGSKVKPRELPLPPKPDAIMVKTPGGKTFADLFKELKDGAGEKLKGIETIRRSRGGDLIIELEKRTDPMEFEKTVKETLGDTHSVRKLRPRVTFEIKGIDPTLTSEDIKSEIAREFGDTSGTEVEIKTTRFGYGGTKNAIVVLTAEGAAVMDKERRIKIGLTYCKCGRAPDVVRCFRCHDFGHRSYECTTRNSVADICRRCGAAGHRIDGCTAKRCCILCIRKGMPSEKAEHVAGAANCPQFRKYLAGLKCNRNDVDRQGTGKGNQEN